MHGNDTAKVKRKLLKEMETPRTRPRCVSVGHKAKRVLLSSPSP